MTDNKIVAAAEGKVSALEGAGLVQDAADLFTQVENGQWAGSLASLLSAGFTIKDTIQDPMAKLISMGLGWVIEFFDPLNVWLDWLTGDQEQLTVAAETWSGISTELRTAAQDLDDYYQTDTGSWSGPAVDQYKEFCADRVNLYHAAAGAAAASANLISRNKVLLTMVRSIVRQLITDAVGKVISIVLRYPPPATLAASGEVVAQVQRSGNAIVDLVRKLQQAFKNAGQMLKQSGNIFKEVKYGLRSTNSLVAEVSQRTMSSAVAARVYSNAMGYMASGAAAAGKGAVKSAGVEAAKGLPQQVFVETVKEPTKYGTGRVDETQGEEPR